VNIRLSGKLLILREVGSAMSSRWDKYLPDCDCLMVRPNPSIAETNFQKYVIDISDTGSFASAWILLNEVLNQRLFLDGKPIMLVFNKSDLSDPVTRAIAFNTLRVDDLLSLAAQKGLGIHVCYGSSTNLKLAESILKWLSAMQIP
jgi:hypothetical protein